MLFNYLYCFVYFTFHIKIVMSFSLAKIAVNKENRGITLATESNVSLSMDYMNSAVINNNTLIRVKRQSGGAGKFTDAAKMPQVKIMRLFTQLFKNLWSYAYVGGVHPFHHEIPKVIVTLYKQKIVEFFVPDVGGDPEKETA